jgi:hypothetical protein
MRTHTGFHLASDPIGYSRDLFCLVFQDSDRGRGPVEHRNDVVALFGIAVDVGYLGAEEPIGVCPDLVGCAIVDAKRA